MHELKIDEDLRAVTVDGVSIELTPREYDLLAFLAARPWRIFSRDQLLRQVWVSRSERPRPATVTEFVHRLRAKTEGSVGSPRRLVTVRGAGYRFESGERPDRSPSLAQSGAHLSPDATIVSVDGIIHYASAASLKLLAANDSEVVGQNFFTFVGPASISAAIIRGVSIITGHSPRAAKMWILRADGVEVLVEMASMPVLWREQQATQVMMWALDCDHSVSQPNNVVQQYG
ncbi:MAG: winged helix-turn-helix domain-containing protein [Acidimicrobiales bacterium]